MTEFVSVQQIILVDDDDSLRAATVQTLELAGLAVVAYGDPSVLLNIIDRDFSGVIISDIRMPKMDGFQLFAHVKSIDPEIPVILITGHADVPMAISALKDGVFDFLPKPFANDHLVASACRALETRQLIMDNRMLRSAATAESNSPLIGDSEAMVQLRDTIVQIAKADVDVLIEGETGTGKELVAHLLHSKGPRRGQAFVAINCGALPEQLAEAELFGHDRNIMGQGPIARDGYVVQANRGTLFLDEIDSMPMTLQANLLRILEERNVLPIGAREPRHVDIRVVAAAKQDLLESARQGSFREDLFYRLNVVRLRLPPLRERRDDIPQLFAYFAQEAAEKAGGKSFVLTDVSRRHLIEHDWPGNVRELRNFAYAEVLGLQQSAINGDDNGQSSLPDRVAAFEAQLIRDALTRAKGNINEALALLQIPRKTLYDKAARHQIEPKIFRRK